MTRVDAILLKAQANDYDITEMLDCIRELNAQNDKLRKALEMVANAYALMDTKIVKEALADD